MKRCARYEVALVRNGNVPYEIPNHPMNSSEAAKEMVATIFKWMKDLPNEKFMVLALDTKMVPIGFAEVTSGTLDAGLVHPREVFRIAFNMNASAILIVHNHPSGELTPSRGDWAVYKRLKEAGTLLGVPVHDSLIVGPTFVGDDVTVRSMEGDL